MAIIRNMWLRGSKKRLGGSVLYQAMGQTRQRELATEVFNPRTQSQMKQRVRWANLVAFYRANRSWMKYAFETKKANQTEYNKLMSLNVSSSRIYLPKNIAAAGGCVVTNYIITQGSLPSIEQIRTTDGNWQTNIVVTPSAVYNNMSVSGFSQMLIQYNPAIRQGDQLSFIRMTQQTNSDTGVPYVVVREYEMIVDVNGPGRIEDFFPRGYFDFSEDSEDNRLQVKDSGLAGGWALILSRTIAGKTYVSSQRVIVANNDALITAYSSDAALQAAIASYGDSADAFLSSTTADTDNQPAPTLSIINISLAGEAYTSSNSPHHATGDSIALGVLFNGQIPTSAVVEADVTYWLNHQSYNSPIPEEGITTQGNLATLNWGTVPDAGQAYIDSIEVYIDNAVYRIVFNVPPQVKEGGLE